MKKGSGASPGTVPLVIKVEEGNRRCERIHETETLQRPWSL